MGNAAKNERTSIDDYILPEDKLNSGQYPREEIFEAQVEGNTIGPFWQEDLKDFVKDAGLYDSDTLVKNIDDSHWSKIQEHVLFQRRRPSIVGDNDLQSNEDRYFLLKDGHKTGPYSKEELIAKTNNLEILFTDYVSVDEGASWGKIYEIEGFERRHLMPSNLPEMPSNSVLNDSVKDVDEALAKSKKDGKDALVSLAYIGHLNEGKKKYHIDEKAAQKAAENKEDQGENKSSTLLLVFLSVAAGALAFVLWNTLDTQQETKAKKAKIAKPKGRVKMAEDTTSTIEPKKEVKRAPAVKKAVTKPRPKVKVTKKRVITRSSESIKKAEFYKKKRLKGRTVINEMEVAPEAIFDDGTEALELDPIRQRVSKDVIDPELEAYDENTPIEDLEDISRQIVPLDELDGDYESEFPPGEQYDHYDRGEPYQEGEAGYDEGYNE